MLAAIEASIQRLIPHDYAIIALHDLSSPHQLQVQELPSSSTSNILGVHVIPMEGTPEGWAFTNQEPLLMTQIDEKNAGRPTLNSRLELNRVAGFL